jgi:hypothetical protein
VEACPDCVVVPPPSKRMSTSLTAGVAEFHNDVKMDLELFLKRVAHHSHFCKCDAFATFMDVSEHVRCYYNNEGGEGGWLAFIELF